MEAATGLAFYEEILRRGHEQGRHEAALLHLQRTLHRRFGPSADDLSARLAAYDRATLELLLDQAIDAGSLAEFSARLPT